MYSIGPLAKDEVVPLSDMPQSSIGAPCPVVVADESYLAVAFYLEVRDDNWDGTSVRVVGPETEGEPFAIVAFRRPRAHFFGPPNDEAFSGHPLESRGLSPYGAFEIRHSSWLQYLVKMNRVHRYHQDRHFANDRHFVLTFHDSTFECIAEGYNIIIGVGSRRSAMNKMIEGMERKGSPA
jgi:hypothetical protein